MTLPTEMTNAESATRYILGSVKPGGLTEEQRTLVRDLASGHDYAAPYDASSDRNGRHHKVAAALRAALALIDRQAAELHSIMQERDSVIELIRRADIYVAAHAVAAKEALDECQEALDESDDDSEDRDCREIVDDINEAEALRAEIHKALAARRLAEGERP